MVLLYHKQICFRFRLDHHNYREYIGKHNFRSDAHRDGRRCKYPLRRGHEGAAACHGGKMSMNFIDGHAEQLTPPQWATIGKDAGNVYLDNITYKYMDGTNTALNAL